MLVNGEVLRALGGPAPLTGPGPRRCLIRPGLNVVISVKMLAGIHHNVLLDSVLGEKMEVEKNACGCLVYKCTMPQVCREECKEGEEVLVKQVFMCKESKRCQCNLSNGLMLYWI